MEKQRNGKTPFRSNIPWPSQLLLGALCLIFGLNPPQPLTNRNFLRASRFARTTILAMVLANFLGIARKIRLEIIKMAA